MDDGVLLPFRLPSKREPMGHGANGIPNATQAEGSLAQGRDTPGTNAQHGSGRPALLALVHIPKTGGTSLTEWWLLQFPGARLYRYWQVGCFFALFPDIFPHERCRLSVPYKGGDRLLGTAPSTLGCWRDPSCWRAPIAVEFHADSLHRFWSTLEPALKHLRAKYADAGGLLLTATVIREPLEHIVSYYRMWRPNRCPRNCNTCVTPSRRCDAVAGVIPIDEWLPHSRGLQAAALLGVEPFSATLRHPDAALGCHRDALRLASSRLSAFDVVGVVETHFAAFQQELWSRFQFATGQVAFRRGFDINPVDKSATARALPPVSKEAAMSSLQRMPRSKAPVHEATRCDQTLYSYALRVAPKHNLQKDSKEAESWILNRLFSWLFG